MGTENKTAEQPLLFEREIPRMPEGYYSSGPNPNLRRFVEEHATPYDPATDDYHVSDLSAELKGNRHSAAYNFLGYSSKKPYEPITRYVEHFTHVGDTVLDPFCGSGGVGFVANTLGRKAILIDASPLATMITAAYCTPLARRAVEKAFDSVEQRVAALRCELYGTKCHLCDSSAEIQSVVYSQTYRCRKCFEVVPLASCGQGKSCPNCGEKVSTRQQRLGVMPYASEIRCLDGCREVSFRRYDDDSPKAREYFSADASPSVGASSEHQCLQGQPMLAHDEDSLRWGVLWRPYHEGIRTVGDFFTQRNLAAILDIKSQIGALRISEEVERIMLLALGSIVPSASKQQRYYPGSTFPSMVMAGVLYVPPVNQEINVYRRFLSKRRSIIRGIRSIMDHTRSVAVCISTQDARDLSAIPSNSIDYVFTDPPYSGRVQYGELNHLQEACLGLDTHWIQDEIIVNDFRGWDLDQWAARLEKAMAEMFRVLKPGRWASVCYHDSDASSWIKLQDLMLSVGFVPGEAKEISSMETGWLSLKMHTSTNITKRDLVVNFRKPRLGEFSQLALFGDEDAATFADKARAIVCEELERRPGSPSDRLYDQLVSRMVRKGEFERYDFDDLLRSVAEQVSGRWYLLATADQVDEAESAKEAATAGRLEAFMNQYLSNRREETGIHFSDLFEQNLYVQDKPRRDLKEWLPEFFFKTVDGTWRPPADDDERAQKEALRTSGTLRRIKRFGRALLEGVPPHDQDRPPNAATAADWIRQCRRAGLYDIGRVLYEKGGFTFDELGEQARLEVDEDYQICVRRS